MTAVFSHRVGAGVLALAGAVVPVTALGAPSSGESGASGARAAITPPIVVLESHVGQRSDESAAVLAPLLDELDACGLVVRPAAVLDRLGGRVPRPGALDTTTAAITEPAESGYAAYTRGQFAEAEQLLTLALVRIHRNPALLVLDTHNLDATFRVLVALALSRAKRGDTAGSVAAMIELIRTFHQPITRADYGPDAEQFYRAVARQVQAMGTGELTITVDNDQAVIFVDGQIRGLGRAALADLVPGSYRVFVQVPGTLGRRYEIDVNANELSALRIDWQLDGRLAMTERWVGFLFATETERRQQDRLAGLLARRSGQLIAVVALAQQPDGADRGTVTASLYDPTGDVVRSAEVELDGAAAGKLRQLARFLADGSLGTGVIARGAARTAGAPPSRLVPELLVGAGTAAVVAGSVLYAIDQEPSPDLPSYRNTAPAGLAVGAVGLAAVGMGLWLWTTRNRSATPIISIAGRHGFIGWAGAL